MVSRERANSFRGALGSGRRLDLVDSVRQMDCPPHSRSTRSRRRQPTVDELRQSWLSINHNQRQSKEAPRHRHQQQTFITKNHNLVSCSAQSLDKTTSGGRQKISAAGCELNRANQGEPTRTKGMKLRLIFCRLPLVSLSMVAISVALLMLANQMNSTICDPNVGSSNNNSKLVNVVARAGPREPDLVHHKRGPNQRSSVEPSPNSEKSSSSASSTSASHKERALSSLMDSIERQHMNLSPGIRSLELARPLKFHSGSETLRAAETGSLDNVQINTHSSHHQTSEGAKQNLKTLHDIVNEHYRQGTRKTSVTLAKVPSSKADQELRQIMMLHEQAVPSHSVKSTGHKVESHTAGASRHHNIIGKHLRRFKAASGNGAISATNSTVGANRLWSVALSPLLSDAASAGKVLTNVVPYLSAGALNKKQARANSTSPFTPRMNGKSILLRPLLGLGEMFAPDIKPQGFNNKYSSPLFAVGNQAETQATYVLSNAINQPHGYSSVLKGLAKDKKHAQSSDNEMVAEASSLDKGSHTQVPVSSVGSWIKIGANQLAQSHSLQDSFRDLLTLSQLPILLNGPVSTAPSELEPGGKRYLSKKVSQQQQIKGSNRTQAFDDILRYAYILANLTVRRKRDPLKVLGPSATSNALVSTSASNKDPLWSIASRPILGGQRKLMQLASVNLNNLLATRKIKPRGVMWDMATDPSLAVTVFHLLERASVALPLGFLLMPLVHMIRNPLNGINLGRIIPARASHRSVDYEELARKINNMDKMLSRALRPTHRESPSLSFMRR